MGFAKELEVIGDFIVENRHSPSVLPMTRHFLLSTPIGNLDHLKRTMERAFDNNNISYLNIICLRIIFPSILGKIDISFLNNLNLVFMKVLQKIASKNSISRCYF